MEHHHHHHNHQRQQLQQPPQWNDNIIGNTITWTCNNQKKKRFQAKTTEEGRNFGKKVQCQSHQTMPTTSFSSGLPKQPATWGKNTSK